MITILLRTLPLLGLIAANACFALESQTSPSEPQPTQTKEQILFQKFSECDARFFEYLAEEKETFEKYAPITVRDKIGFFGSESYRVNAPDRIIKFQNTLEVNGIKIIGFYTDGGVFPEIPLTLLSWGFVVENTKQDTVKQLKKVTYLNDLYAIKDGLVRLDQFNNNTQSWHYRVDPNPTEGRLPPKNMVERAFAVDLSATEGDWQNKTVLDCTLQGAATPELRQQLRPDILE